MMRKVLFCSVICLFVLCITSCANDRIGSVENANDSVTTMVSNTETAICQKPDTYGDTLLGTDEQQKDELTEVFPTENEDSSIMEGDIAVPNEGEDIDNKPTRNNQLIILGKNIAAADKVVFNQEENYVLLPVVTVLESLGAEVIWESRSVAILQMNDRRFILDIETMSFFEEGENINYLIPAPGAVVHHCINDGTFLLDTITINTIAIAIGVRLRIVVDASRYVVEITHWQQ